jgi:hypothetical protein
MGLMADGARKALSELPGRQPKRLIRYNRVTAFRERAPARKATIWLHAVHGDPVMGRAKREYRKEFGYASEEEDALKNLDPGQMAELDVEVTIDNPTPRGMPRLYLAGMSDIEFKASSQTVVSNAVVSRWEIEGVHSGPLLGVPATGTRISLTGITWLAFEREQNPDGSTRAWATDEWTYWDLPSLMQQIGASP